MPEQLGILEQLAAIYRNAIATGITAIPPNTAVSFAVARRQTLGQRQQTRLFLTLRRQEE